MAEFEWTYEREIAAQLVAKGELSMGEIALEISVTERALYEWRKTPEFAARVDSLIEDFRRVLRRRAISFVERRADRLNRDWLKLQKVTEERAADPKMKDVPGGSTGLIVHNVKGVGKGDDFQLVDLYEVDTGLLAELRAIEKQASQELGQWEDKTEVTVGAKLKRIEIPNHDDRPDPDELDADDDDRERPTADETD